MMQSDLQENRPASPPLSSVDLITRSTASAVLFVYALGFIILAFHDAKYGVVQFSPFRARIVLVGFVFTMLVSLAAAAQHYGLAYIAPLEPIFKDSNPDLHLHRGTIRAAGFIFTAALMSSIFGSFLFLHNSQSQTAKQSVWHVVVVAAICLVSLAIFWVAAKIYLRKPGLAVVLSLIAFAIYLAVLAGPGFSSPTNYLTSMLALVGWHVTWIKREKSPLKFALDFRNWLTVLFLIWIYISAIFGDMPQRWGGGQPTSVQVFQIIPSTWAPSNPIDALLLDETEDGLYVLLTPNGKAFFVPRSNVASIFFGPKEDLAQK